jgi:hypothetical protein
MAAEVAPALKITRDDINNQVRRIRDPPEQQQQEVSPAIPYHAIVCPTLSTDSDSSISADLISERTSAENPLDILANQAAVMLEPTSWCTVSTQLTLPNRGNGRLGTEVRDEVIRRNEARREKEAAVVSRKKTKLQGLLISNAKVIKDKMESKTYKLNGKELLVLVRYKRGRSLRLVEWYEKLRLSLL